MKSNNRTPGDPATDWPVEIGFARLLEILGHGTDPDDHTSINRKPIDGRFQTTVRPSRQVIAGAKSKAGSEWADETDYWFGVNPLVPPAQFARKSLAGAKTGRGAESDVQRLVALYADLDFKEGGLVDAELTDTVVEELSDAMDADPHVEVETGGGLHLYWILADEIKGRPAKALLRRFGRMVADIARRHGGKVDSVFDLARVLRIPSSSNWKTGEPRLIVAFETPGWEPISVEQAESRLDAYGIPTEKFGDIEINGGPVISAPAEWEWAEQTCPYVAAVLDQWPTDEPIDGERHRTIMAKATRLAAFWRAGCITEADYDGGVELLRDWLEDHRPEEPGEVAAAVAWGVEHIATRSEKAISTELGHDPEHPDGRDRAMPDLIFPGGKRPKLKVVKPEIEYDATYGLPTPVEPADEFERQLEIDLGDYDEPEDDQQQTWAPEDERWNAHDDYAEEAAAVDALPIDLEDLADDQEDAPSVVAGEIDASEIRVTEAGKLADRVLAEPTAERTRMLADALVELDRLTDNELASLVVFLATVGQRSSTGDAIISGSMVVDWKDPETRTEAGMSKARAELDHTGAFRVWDVNGEQVTIVGQKTDGSPITGWSDMHQPNELLIAAAAASSGYHPYSPRSRPADDEYSDEIFEPGNSPAWHLAHLLGEVDPALSRCERCGAKLHPIGRSRVLADCTACYYD